MSNDKCQPSINAFISNMKLNLSMFRSEHKRPYYYAGGIFIALCLIPVGISSFISTPQNKYLPPPYLVDIKSNDYSQYIDYNAIIESKRLSKLNYIRNLADITGIDPKLIQDHGDKESLGFNTLTVMNDVFYVFSNGDVIMGGRIVHKNGVPDLTSSFQMNRKAFVGNVEAGIVPSFDIPNNFKEGSPHIYIISTPNSSSEIETVLASRDDIQATIIMVVDADTIDNRNLLSAIVSTNNPWRAWMDVKKGIFKPDYIQYKEDAYPFDTVTLLLQSVGLSSVPIILNRSGKSIKWFNDINLVIEQASE